MSNEDTTLDRIRFQILEKRVDASAFSVEWQEWYMAVREMNETLSIQPYLAPKKRPEEDEEDDGEISLRKKLDLGIIDEDEYYSSVSGDGFVLPDRPAHDWCFTPALLDLETVTAVVQNPRCDLRNETVIYVGQGGFAIYKIRMDHFMDILLDYRQRKHGKRDIVKILSELKESPSSEEGEDTRI